ncbi:MAG: DNA replication/repair protein RecF [Alicyclobacillus sp.]|nr:DNA replication/repair protein RecF [Alicyclobacillus sp.]
MLIRTLQLQHFRNYESACLEFSSDLNILIGENAQGKTNALEAIYLLAIGKSHRSQRDAELIRWDQPRATIASTVSLRDRDYQLEMQIRRTGKQVFVNGISLAKMTEFVGHFQVVLFAPEDLQLVKAGPGVRRRFMDVELGQTYKSYLYHLSQYQRALQQRNTLLKQSNQPIDWDYVATFEQQMVEHGTHVLLRRFAFITRIQLLANDVYQSIAHGREELTIRYECSIPGIQLSSSLNQDEVMQHFQSALHAKRSSDVQYGYTTIGPHRDDMVLLLDGKPVLGHASQGQQRTVALSLRLAEIEFIHDETNEYPVLLLDDVLSELDNNRQRNLVFNMSEKVQTILTTTSLYQLGEQLQATARLYHVRSGIIRLGG